MISLFWRRWGLQKANRPIERGAGSLKGFEGKLLGVYPPWYIPFCALRGYVKPMDIVDLCITSQVKPKRFSQSGRHS